MHIKSAMFVILCTSALGLSGCSNMWNGVSHFSDFMAEKTAWISVPGLRGSQSADIVQTASLLENTENTQIDNIVSNTQNDVIYAQPVVDVIETPRVDEFGFFTPEPAISYDSEGNAIIDTSPVPCPDGTYLAEDNSCMLLE